MNNHNETPIGHLSLICASNSILLERLLQIVRYRGFQVLNMNSNDLENGETEVNFLVKGQAKLTTLKKSLEIIIDVKECYLTDDKKKLTKLMEVGFSNMNSSYINNTQQQQAAV